MPAAATNTAALAGQLMLALIFVVEGWLKINQYEGTVKYMLAYGIPGALLPLVIVTELAGGNLDNGGTAHTLRRNRARRLLPVDRLVLPPRFLQP